MGMNIKDPDVHAMTKELAQLTGLSLTAAVKMAVERALIQAKTQDDCLRAASRSPKSALLEQRLTEISLRCAALPDCDPSNMDEILGYDV